MITIPTRDLVGIVADAIPFASTDAETPATNAVRVEWDGGQLHAMATDHYRIAWSTWDPDDPGDEVEQPDLFTEPGGTDEPWHFYCPLDDAKSLAAAYKLPPKEGGCPLTVEHSRGLLTVKRARETGHSALTMTIVGLRLDNPPDIRRLLAGHSAVDPVTEVAYTGKWLSDFGAKVRQRGPLRLTFAGKLTLVAVGERFTGAIVPVREDAGQVSRG
jgi:hypothetical protein